MAKQLKEIEIPFGAYDSELDGFEYTIPEGYEAEIRDGKIVVRKIESEDEKIRNALIELVHDTTGNSLWVYYNVHKKDALAWLEKQGEHAKFINGIQVGDKVTRNEDGVLVNLSQLNRVAKKDEKQGKQKDILEDAVLDSNKDGLIADTIRYKREKQGEQKPNKCMYSNDNYTDEERKVLCDGCDEDCKLKQKPAWNEKGTNGNNGEIPNSSWSEEDIVAIDCAVEVLSKDLPSLAASIERLKSLKDRIPSKQEWSEEDKRIIDRLCEILYDCHSYGKCSLKLNEYSNLYDWLKSLRPQNRWKPSDELDASSYQVGIKRVLETPESYGLTKYNWKPSDEQMKILNEVLNFAANHENPHWNDYIFGTLHNLIIQLKKLREE